MSECVNYYFLLKKKKKRRILIENAQSIKNSLFIYLVTF